MRIAIRKAKSITEGMGFMKSDPVITYDHMHEVKESHYITQSKSDQMQMLLFVMEEAFIISMALIAALFCC
jgi:hypothetical protein